MLRNVAVTNEQNGRREFSSAHVDVAQALLRVRVKCIKVKVMVRLWGRREFSSAHVAQALLLDLPSPEGLTLTLTLPYP